MLDKLRALDTATLADKDKNSLSELLKAKNEDQLVSGFLTKGSLTKEKGPLGTKFAISGKPDSKLDSPWLQLLLKLSDEAMEELLTVDPSLQAPSEE